VLTLILCQLLALVPPPIFALLFWCMQENWASNFVSNFFPLHDRITFPSRMGCFINHSPPPSRQQNYTQSPTIVMSIVAAASAPIDPAAVATFTASQAASPTSPEPSLVCDWAHCALGCLIPGCLPNDICGIDGCKVIFHQACACQWDKWQYHQDDPTGQLDKNPYNSEGLKQSTCHHTYQEKIL
jgi:hypothetical protein